MLDRHDEKIKTALDNLGKENISSNLDGWPAIQVRLDKNKVTRKPLRFKRVALLAANTGLIAVLVLVVAWLSRPQQTISAAEILAKAVRVAQGSTESIKSYHGVVIERGQDKGIVAESHIWRKYPLQKRVEEYLMIDTGNASSNEVKIPASVALSTPTDQAKDFALRQIIVINSKRQIYYNGTTDIVPTTRPLDITIVTKGVTILDNMVGPLSRVGLGDPESIEYIVEDKTSRAKFVSTNTVANRSVYGIEFPGFGFSCSGSNCPRIERVMTWIDQETYLQLGEEWYNDKNELVQSWEYTQIEINPELDDSVFTFKPLAGVLVVDADFTLRLDPNDYTSPLIDPNNYKTMMADTAKQATFDIFVPPQHNPLTDPFLMPAPPIYDAAQGGLVFLKYQALANALTLLIVEGESSVIDLYNPCEREQCKAIKVGDIDAQYLDRQDSEDTRWLHFKRGETGLLMRTQANPSRADQKALTKEELLSVAESLILFERK